ncbi:MAG: hypothetical protein IT208_11390 [Chthonomonadales bacterium]|nr:hypothetical protein [Chthonomonadales bacterium]
MRARVDVWDAQYLWLINDIVHDASYAVSGYRLGPDPSILTVPFRRPREDRRPYPLFRRRPAPEPVAWLLQFGNVADHRITDDQGIDEYPMNGVNYNAHDGTLRVETSIPTVFILWVAAIHITLVAEPDT